MFSFLDVSLDTANQFYTWGWRASVIGGIVTGISLVFLFLGTRVRDKDFDSKIANLTLEAANSNERASALDREGKVAQAEAARANERAAALEKEAAQARLELEQIKEKQTPRSITPAQSQMFVAALSSVPKGNVTVQIFNQEAEITQYANQLRSMIVAAGFNSGIMVAQAIGSSLTPVGVILVVRDPHNPPPFAVPLRNALSAMGTKVDVQVDSSMSATDVLIVVGRKE